MSEHKQIRHPSCVHCQHFEKRTRVIRVEFVINEVIGTEYPMDGEELANQLEGALPREWFDGYEMAEWSVISIRKLST